MALKRLIPAPIARLFPQKISSQLAVLMIISVVAFNIVMTTTFIWFPHKFGHPPEEWEPPPPNGMADGIGNPFPQQRFRPFPGQEFGPGPEPRPGFGLHPLLPPLLPTLLFLTISMIVMGLWAMRALIAPLKGLVQSVEQYRVGGGSDLLAEEGPSEIRMLARALNEMHVRNSNLMAERTRMLAAISHDLRTPITRLRLRAEFMPASVEQSRLLADLDHMEALVRGALTYLRGGRTGEGAIATDLGSLLQTIADQFYDVGSEVRYDGPERVVTRIRPHELQRAVTNLVENAIRYSDAPEIRLVALRNGDLEIRVEDSGPGIPNSLKAAMTEPFTRGDAARSMNGVDGLGLGLAIVRSIAEAHGGRLELRDRTPCGLTAVILLPASIVVRDDPGGGQ